MINKLGKLSAISAGVAVALASMSTQAAEPALEEVIVTGSSSRGYTPLETSYGVSILDAASIDEDMPSGTADLVDAIPGIWGETQGGEANTAMSARGTRQGFNSLISMQEDGLPITYSPFFSEFEVRYDLTYDRVEAVLGGPSGVFTAQGAAATVNFSSRMPTENEGQVRFSLTDFGQARADVFVGGPISENWTAAIGGYYRYGEGPRDVDFTANDGGQIRASLKRDLNDGLGALTLSYKYIDDHTIFQHNHPVKYVNSKPKAINSVDPRKDSLYGSDNKVMNVKTASGINPIDLQTGEHANSNQFSVKFDYDFANGWRFSEHGRIVSIDMDATDMRGFNTDELGLASDFIAANEALLFDAFDADSVGLVRVNDGVLISDPDGLNGNGLLSKQKPLSYKKTQDNFINDFKVVYENDSFATTFGLQYWNVETTSSYIRGDYLLDVKANAERYDLTAFDADGNVVGHLTDGGILTHSSLNNSGSLDTESINPYFNVEWQVLDNLRVDAGVRYEDVEFRATGMDVDFGVAPPPGQDNPLVLADDAIAVSPNGTSYKGDISGDETTWTIGANYLINDDISVYVRYADAHDFGFTNEFSYFNIPGFGVPAGSNLGLEFNPAKIEFAEIGTRMEYDNFTLWATLFFTRNDDLASREFEEDGQLKSVTTDNEALGLEFQGSWKVTDNFDLDFSGVVQNSELKDNDPTDSSLDGNQIERLPNEQVRISPRYHFENGHVYLSANYYGKRYATNENVIEFDAYTQIDAGLFYHFNDSMTVSLQGSNLTNELTFFSRGEGDFSLDENGNGYGYAQAGAGRTFMATIDYNF